VTSADFVKSNHLDGRLLEAFSALEQGRPLAEISAQIRAAFEEGEFPPDLAEQIGDAYREIGKNASLTDLPVAVRSSATAEDLAEASFAGQQDTYLNVRSEKGVLNAARRCFGSLWSERAIAYRSRQGISPEAVALAVVVQQMVPAESAGVMFTANPVTGSQDEIVFNASWGLGEAIVSGLVVPDHIVVNKRK